MYRGRLALSIWGGERRRERLREEETAGGAPAGRAGPRSRVVDSIFLLLLSRPMRSAEIAEILGFSSRYVSSYLSYWRARGYVEYNSGLWYLTPRGEEYARAVYMREARRSSSDEYVLAAQRLLSSSIKQTVKDKTQQARGGAPDSLLPFTAELTGKPSNKLQERVSVVTCALSKLKSFISEDELDILAHLASHYARWGTTYMYLDQLQEKLEADYSWLMRTLRTLQSKGLLYIYTDPRLGVRIGFSKNLKELLERCSSGEQL